jgi:hypothetical protein
VNGRAVVSQKTAGEVAEIAQFFGIDLEWNRHLFSWAAQADGRAFEVVMAALAVAIRDDVRRGVTARIRQSILDNKGKK